MSAGPSIDEAGIPAPAPRSGLHDWAALTLSAFVVAVLGLLWTLSAGRFLPPAEYADFTAAASLIYFAAMALGPMSQTIAWFTATSEARGESAGNTIRAAERRLVVLCGVALLVFAAVSPLVSGVLHFRSTRPLFVVLVIVPILAISAIRRGFVQGLGRFPLYSASVAFEAIVRISLLFLAFTLVRDAASSLVTYAVACAIALLLLPAPPAHGEVDLRPLLRFFSLSFLATAIYSAFLYSDILLVKLFFDAKQAALYGAASFVAKGVGMLVAPFYVYAVPYFTRAASSDELRRQFVRLCAWFLALELLAVATLVLLRRPVIAILLGRRYADAADLILPLGVAVATGGLAFIAVQVCASRERFGFVPWYAAGFLIQLAAVALWHETLIQVATAIAGAQFVTLVLVAPKIAGALARNASPETPASRSH